MLLRISRAKKRKTCLRICLGLGMTCIFFIMQVVHILCYTMLEHISSITRNLSLRNGTNLLWTLTTGAYISAIGTWPFLGVELHRPPQCTGLLHHTIAACVCIKDCLYVLSRLCHWKRKRQSCPTHSVVFLSNNCFWGLQCNHLLRFSPRFSDLCHCTLRQSCQLHSILLSNAQSLSCIYGPQT